MRPGSPFPPILPTGIATCRRSNKVFPRLRKVGLELVFVPHLLPITRGIHATLYARLKNPGADVHPVFTQRYAHEHYVDVLPRMAPTPNTASVTGSNVCRMSVFQPRNGTTVVILAVEDNLVKGAAGQAVQNMNILYGLDETTGLDRAGIWP